MHGRTRWTGCGSRSRRARFRRPPVKMNQLIVHIYIGLDGVRMGRQTDVRKKASDGVVMEASTSTNASRLVGDIVNVSC